MRVLLLTTLLAWLTSPAYTQIPEPGETPASVSERQPGHSGISTLTHEAVLARPLDEVWELFNTAPGMMSWMVPFAHVDLTIGGVMETSYDPAAKLGDADNTRAEIISLDPGRMLSAWGAVPSQYAEARAEGGLWGVTHFEAIDPLHTRVTIRMLGWGAGPSWDAAYAFFVRGNAYYVDLLEDRFGDDDDEQSAAAEAMSALVGRSWEGAAAGSLHATAGPGAGRVVLRGEGGGGASLFVLGPDPETGALGVRGFLPDGSELRGAVGMAQGALELTCDHVTPDGQREPRTMLLTLRADGGLDIENVDARGHHHATSYAPVPR